MSLYVYRCAYQEGVQDLIQKHKTQAIFMGVRRTDPHGRTLCAFSPSSEGWPDFMRVNPILDWSYDNVWQLLHGCRLDYCVLYDQGYTSLGDVSSTIRNPAAWPKRKVCDYVYSAECWRLFEDICIPSNACLRLASTYSSTLF